MTATAAEARFHRLYDRYHREVLAYFLRRVDRDSAFECTEDVYVVAWRKLDEVPEGERALPWLYAVAWRVLANRRRKLMSKSSHEESLLRDPVDDGAETEAQVVRNEESTELLEAVAKLSDRDQELLRLAVWEELPHAEIAEVLGCSVNAVDVRLHRAVRRLRKGLNGRRHITGRGRPAFMGGD